MAWAVDRLNSPLNGGVAGDYHLRKFYHSVMYVARLIQSCLSRYQMGTSWNSILCVAKSQMRHFTKSIISYNRLYPIVTRQLISRVPT